MAIEKGLYGMPEGIEDMEEGEAMLAIDTMSDEGVEVVLEDGSVEITFGEEIEELDAAPFDANLADYLEDGQLEEISGDLCEAVEGDMAARRDWADSYVAGLDVRRANRALGKRLWRIQQHFGGVCYPVPSRGDE